MNMKEIKTNKKKYMPFLLLADEEERMIERYLNRGNLFVLEDHDLKGICIVTDEGNGIIEIKNIAVLPKFQKMGYGKYMIDFIINKYKNNYNFIQVGTGDSPLTVPFYEKCGFYYSHKIPNFFVDNYEQPIFECGKQLIDMVYFKRKL